LTVLVMVAMKVAAVESSLSRAYSPERKREEES
jgi:hypothetical protein